MGVQREMERKGGDTGEGMSIEGGKGWGLKVKRPLIREDLNFI